MNTEDKRDWALLRGYVDHGAEGAFASIVERHMGLVYATSRRQTGDSAMAEDVAQIVFMILAKKARVLLPGTILSRWLFKTACLASRDVLKRERRRIAYERLSVEASAMPDNDRSIEVDLDAALGRLSAADWDAIHLRYYQDLSNRDIGMALGIPEASAQKRVVRAMERLRRLLGAGGAIVSTVAITEVLDVRPAHALSPSEIARAVTAIRSDLPLQTERLFHLSEGVMRRMAWKYATVGLAVGICLVGAGIAQRSIGAAGAGASHGTSSKAGRSALPTQPATQTRQVTWVLSTVQPASTTANPGETTTSIADSMSPMNVYVSGSRYRTDTPAMSVITNPQARTVIFIDSNARSYSVIKAPPGAAMVPSTVSIGNGKPADLSMRMTGKSASILGHECKEIVYTGKLILSNDPKATFKNDLWVASDITGIAVEAGVPFGNLCPSNHGFPLRMTLTVNSLEHSYVGSVETTSRVDSTIAARVTSVSTTTPNAQIFEAPVGYKLISTPVLKK